MDKLSESELEMIDYVLDRFEDVCFVDDARKRLENEPLEYSTQSWEDLWNEILENAEK